jgi:ParB family transcriptional regulator, chromosome partitioning protein
MSGKEIDETLIPGGALGWLEEIHTRRISPSKRNLRADLGPLGELMWSIEENGLLQPILVRPLADNYEVVCGNRRFEACKKLGMRSIPCHIVDLDDKDAYELSLVENLQRETLSAIDQARAFRRYIEEYGYGGTSELARKIGKSEQYVSQHVRLLSLPEHVLDKVTRRLVSPSTAAELIGLDEDVQDNVAQVIVDQHLSSREVRRFVREVKSSPDLDEVFPISSRSATDDSSRTIDRSLRRAISALKITMIRLDDVIEHLADDGWVVDQTIGEYRRTVHQQIDVLTKMRLKRKRTLFQGPLMELLLVSSRQSAAGRERRS